MIKMLQHQREFIPQSGGLVNDLVGNDKLADIMHQCRHQQLRLYGRLKILLSQSFLMLFVNIIHKQLDIQINISGMVKIIWNPSVDSIRKYLSNGNHQLLDLLNKPHVGYRYRCL